MSMTKANGVVEIIKNRGINAETMTKNDNGVTRIGITVGDGNVRPTIYPDFMQNNLENIADHVIEVYEREKGDHPEFEDIISKFDDFDFVKRDIIPCVLKETADDMVQRDYLDIKVNYRYILKNGNASVVIRTPHINTWGITEDELFKIAKDNVISKYEDVDLGSLIPMLSGIPSPFIVLKLGGNFDNYGASALLFPELFEKYGDGTIIIPSSIHELLILTEKTDNVLGLVDMIKSVNESQLSPNEVLADHPYVYEDGKIKEVM